MRWILRDADAAEARELERALGLHPVAARVLVSRGFGDPLAVERFLAASLADLPDPFAMKGMERAVERIIRAIRERERVVVYGDYDVDGVTSTTMLVGFLRGLGADVGHYVPQRLKEGYGLNPAAIDHLVSEGARLIVTVDCGVTAVEEVARASRAGVDVVVVDHHKAPPELPRAYAMLNPHQPGCGFPFKDLCAAGVTFHLLMALRKRLREEGFFERRPEPNLRRWLDLAALGTVADVVPLVGPNRILVQHGLRELEKAERIGVAALKRVSGIAEGPVTAGQIGFRLGPRINAAGRLDDAGAAVALLLSDDPAEAEALAEQLEQANQDRQAIERSITTEAMEQAKRAPENVRGLVLSGEDWHPGVVGIVASRVVERFHKPAVVLGIDGDGAKGSCRSIERFNMFEGLGRCADHLLKFGGHHHAAGVTLEAKEIVAFTKAFQAEAKRQLKPSDLVPVIRVDAEIGTHEMTLELAEALSRLQPFGAGNPEPVLSSRASDVETRVLPSRNGDRDHLKFRLGRTDCIGFGLGDSRGLMRGTVKVAYNLTVDDWNGRLRAQAKVKAVDAA